MTYKELKEEQAELKLELERNEVALDDAVADIENRAAKFYETYLSKGFYPFPDGRGANMMIAYECDVVNLGERVNEYIRFHGYCIVFESTVTGAQYIADDLLTEETEDSGDLYDDVEFLDALAFNVGFGVNPTPENEPTPFGNPEDFSEIAQSYYNCTASLLDDNSFEVSRVLGDQIEFDFERAVVCIASVEDIDTDLPPLGSNLSILIWRCMVPTDDYIIYLFDGKYSLPTRALALKDKTYGIQEIRDSELSRILNNEPSENTFEEQALCLSDKDIFIANLLLSNE